MSAISLALGRDSTCGASLAHGACWVGPGSDERHGAESQHGSALMVHRVDLISMREPIVVVVDLGADPLYPILLLESMVPRAGRKWFRRPIATS